MSGSRASAGAAPRSGRSGSSPIWPGAGPPPRSLEIWVSLTTTCAWLWAGPEPGPRRQGDGGWGGAWPSTSAPFVFATVFSDPERGVVIDVAPGRDGAWAFAGLYSRQERAGVQVVSMDCHNPYRHMVRLVFPHALIV